MSGEITPFLDPVAQDLVSQIAIIVKTMSELQHSMELAGMTYAEKAEMLTDENLATIPAFVYAGVTSDKITHAMTLFSALATALATVDHREKLVWCQNLR